MSADIAYDPSEYAGSGQRYRILAGQNLADRDLLYIGVNGRYYKADADAAATMPVVAMALGAIAQGRYGDVLAKGFIWHNTWTWTTGGEVYASGVPGIPTQAAPVAPSLTQIVGMAAAGGSIYFDPTMSALGGAAIAGFVGDYTYLVGRTLANYFVYDTQGVVVQGPGLDADVAINWALTTGGAGCVVYLKESATFAIDDPIIFTANNQVVRGGGRSTFIDGDALGNNEHAFELTAFTDCQIRNLSIQTNDGGVLASHCIFIEDGADNFLVEDVTVVDSDSDGIHIEGTTITGGIVRGCNIIDADGYGILVDMDGGNFAEQIIVDQNRVTGGGTANIEFSASGGNRYCEITNNVVFSGAAEGIHILSFLHGVINDNIVYSNATHGIRVATTSTDNNIEDNVVFNNTFHGIFLESAVDNIVSGNLCELNDNADAGLYDGIHVDASSERNIISNNKSYENHRDGIRILGARNKVTDNKVATNDQIGIFVWNADCQINDNECWDNGQDVAGTYHEIALTADADRCQVHDNHVTSPGDSSEDCIHLADGAIDVSIMGNYCFNGMGSGIALTANNDNCSIIANRCIDNDDYGIEITAATCNDTRVKENHLEGNGTGQFLDSGTDTQTPWFFAPVSDPNATLGRHPAVDMPVNTDTNVYAQILVPLEFQELVTCNVIVSPAGAGDLVWTVDTDYGKICAAEDYNAHSDSGGATDTLLITDLACLDISGALDTPDIAGGDLVGVDFMRDGDNVADTIAGSVYYLGIRMRYV